MIRILSDLHLEAHPSYVPTVMKNEKKQTLVLAGDIAPYVTLDDYFRDSFFAPLSERFKHIIFVPGNHEYYHGDINKGDEKITSYLSEWKNFHFLNGDVIELDGIKFVGCTLWTDIDNANPLAILDGAKMMADYSAIHCGNHLLTPGETIYINKTHAKFLHENVDENCVVITHHPPSYQSIHEKFKGSPLNPFFYNDLDNFILDRQPKLWIHGHTHCSMDYSIENTIVLCNPKGYFNPYSYAEPENPYFEDTLTVEI